MAEVMFDLRSTQVTSLGRNGAVHNHGISLRSYKGFCGTHVDSAKTGEYYLTMSAINEDGDRFHSLNLDLPHSAIPELIKALQRTYDVEPYTVPVIPYEIGDVETHHIDAAVPLMNILCQEEARKDMGITSVCYGRSLGDTKNPTLHLTLEKGSKLWENGGVAHISYRAVSNISKVLKRKRAKLLEALGPLSQGDGYKWARKQSGTAPVHDITLLRALIEYTLKH